MRRLAPLTTIVLLAALSVPPSGALAQDAAPPDAATSTGGDGVLSGLEVRGSPLMPEEGARLQATVELARPAQLDLRVLDFDGRTVRELFHGPRPGGTLDRAWPGDDGAGSRVADGPYRLLATAIADGVTEEAEAWITVADRAVYPESPSFVTIAVDPGHGGEYDGAVAPDGTREADLDLDIGQRLARMLEGSRVNVVITRDADAHVNEPPEERTGDGLIDRDDELAARPDLANLARADLFLSIHNNTAVNRSVGGPATFFYDERPFGARSARLARIVQEEMVAALSEAVSREWEPYDHGALIYPYYVLRGYDPPRLQRPTQMPGVLSEGLFLSNELELALLRRPAIRAAMANAYYRAIAKYLARRGPHVGYELLEAPPGPVVAGGSVTYAVEVRNQGSEPISDWRLRVNAVAAPERYVSRVRDAVPAGEWAIPRLEPGESTTLALELTAPAGGGDWMLLFDARDSQGRRAAEMGSPMLQVRLTTLEPPAPTTDPAPAPSPSGPPSEAR